MENRNEMPAVGERISDLQELQTITGQEYAIVQVGKENKKVRFKNIGGSVVQSTGSSTTDIMSQKSVTDEFDMLKKRIATLENLLKLT